MDAPKRFYTKHPVWSWVIIVFVGLLLVGALIPSEDSADDSDKVSTDAPGEPAAEQQQEPEVELVVDPVGGNYVQGPVAPARQRRGDQR